MHKNKLRLYLYIIMLFIVQLTCSQIEQHTLLNRMQYISAPLIMPLIYNGTLMESCRAQMAQYSVCNLELDI